MLEEKYEKVCNGCEKMRNASGHTEVKLSSSLKKNKANRNTFDNSSLKRVTRKFHPVVVQNNGKEMYKIVYYT